MPPTASHPAAQKPIRGSVARFFGGLNEQNFSQLLLVLVLLYFVAPLVSGPLDAAVPWFNNAVYVVGVLFTLVAAAFITSGNRRTLRFVFGAVVLAILSNAIHVVTNQKVFLIAHHLLMAGVLAVVIASIILYLFEATDVSHYTIFGSLCAYLLMALLWALLYSVVEILDPESFRFPDTVSGSFVESFDGLYFSLVTLTTLGYGDITPVSVQARMLATGEALFGQIYIVVAVARLVSMFSSSKRANPTR